MRESTGLPQSQNREEIGSICWPLSIKAALVSRWSLSADIKHDKACSSLYSRVFHVNSVMHLYITIVKGRSAVQSNKPIKSVHLVKVKAFNEHSTLFSVVFTRCEALCINWGGGQIELN